jgi:DNA-binding MarR family transcriptional regulator
LTNVSGPDDDVKGSPAAAPAATVASSDPGRDALEISKLLVEVLQAGHMTRRAGPEGSAAPPGLGGTFAAGAMSGGTHGAGGAGATHPTAGPIASHVIRAAIHIYGNGPQTIGQLAMGIGVSQGWASRIVDEMERAGYVERQRDPADRRVVRVSLVPAAVERVERVYRWRGDAVEAALDGLSDADRAAVIAFLRRFVDGAREGA